MSAPGSHVISVLTSSFPSRREPARGAFVDRICQVWARNGSTIHVIAPVKIKPSGLAAIVPLAEERDYTLRRPLWISFGVRRLAGIRLAKLSYKAYAAAARRGLFGRMKSPIWYGHFLFPAGYSAVDLKQRYGGKAIVCLGESNIHRYSAEVGEATAKATGQALDGVIALSDENARFASTTLGVPSDRILRLGNAVDAARFFPIDRAEARAQLGVGADVKHILVFVGHFDSRKGVRQACQVVNETPDLWGVFLGSGPDRPRCDRLLFSGSVPQAEVCTWLNASDVFCLPSAAEGSCNAIHEACATGVPVVASRIPANAEFSAWPGVELVDRDDAAAILDAVAAAIREYPHVRPGLMKAARDRLAEWNEELRAEAILSWINTLPAAD